ncbi:hypothetical protein A3C59_03545 [Candidatus Daviesbacteria bacterium RIFCSPHIGHO2_02_FULL_36_13]|uniref:PDZ domain-containing protein n=1 Tax=Candidatus Daviesbacteria bacterium RIFCSPHIGHO2_02_FULL_36_13 TaxID=1797768 RepID=A0A1F5JQ25_9BACT|nr:MAG: hypothetical protein A3C59_03545 [Candidatus Daviesbacteria bacterium RIFCSPHIGHO2_02_FULL_36_13]
MKNFFQKIDAKVVLISLLAFLLGWQLGHKDVDLQWTNFKPTVSVINRDVPSDVNIDFKLFWDTWDLLSKTYIDKKALDPEKLFYGAISGMVAAVGDPYTVFLPPDQQKSTKEELSGSFDGVGIELGFNKDKRLAVISPLDGTPAQKAGVKPGDLIVEIEGKDTNGITLPEAVKQIRGPKGTSVVLTTFRDGDSETKKVTLTRDTIIVKSVSVTYKSTPSGKEVAVIKLSRFGERTDDEWNQIVSEVLSKGLDGIILDVRNNPGGYLEGAVYIASEFLEGGDVVLQENNQGAQTPYKVNRAGRLTKIPMKVLINKGSASASEIVAGALQDRKRAQLIGEKSFGKGTIQEAQDLTVGTGIHITVAKWLTPNGRWVNDTEGLEVDVTVEDEKEDAIKDPQLEKALELLD